MPLHERLVMDDERAGRRVAPWLLLAAGLLVGFIGGGYLLRESIMRLAPATERIYALFGIGVADPAAKLEIANLKSEQRRSDGQRLVDISGVVFNPTSDIVALPPLVIVFTDAAGKQIDPVSVFRFQEAEIDAGENLAFQAERVAMPEGANSFRVSFGNVTNGDANP